MFVATQPIITKTGELENSPINNSPENIYPLIT